MKHHELIKLSKEVGYDKFHPDWFLNNKLDPKTWYLELCLLQKWLRDEHGIHIEINKYGNMWSYTIEGFNHSHMRTSYEEALEEGLKSAFLII